MANRSQVTADESLLHRGGSFSCLFFKHWGNALSTSHLLNSVQAGCYLVEVEDTMKHEEQPIDENRPEGQVIGVGAHQEGCGSEALAWPRGKPLMPRDVGYFVTLEGDKVRKSSEPGAYVLGITSARPAVLANSGELRWQHKFVTDEWGRVQYQEVVVPAVLDGKGTVLPPPLLTGIV